MMTPFVPLVLYFAWQGQNTSGLLLLTLVLGFLRWGPQPQLYAVMCWLALVMELWGTHLGNWAWAHQVPWTPLTAMNPPLLCGAIYALGDLLVYRSVAGLTRGGAELPSPSRLVPTRDVESSSPER